MAEITENSNFSWLARPGPGGPPSMTLQKLKLKNCHPHMGCCCSGKKRQQVLADGN